MSTDESTTPAREVAREREVPRVFGEYQLLATLAAGGMGTIHLARRVGFAPEIQRFCVVKRLRKELARPDFVRRFKDEARVVVTLNHRAICHVFDVGIAPFGRDDEHYLAMELIEGVSLREVHGALVRRGERMAPEVALTILDEVLEALQYAHTRLDPATGAPLRIVHRDVSPQNVMLSFAGEVKLIDFGIVSSSIQEERTVGGMVLGKLGYMAPEQARGEALDARTDVYAAAVMLYELLTGERFYGGLPKDLVTLHVTEGTWTPPLEHVPAPLRAPLLHALAPEPEARTASADAFQRELLDAHPARGVARELRELIVRVLPDAQPLLEDKMRGLWSVAPPPDEETRTAHTRVKHLARSDEDTRTASAVLEPTRVLREPRMERAEAPPWRARALTLLVVLLFAALPVAAWLALRADELDDGARPAPDAGVLFAVMADAGVPAADPGPLPVASQAGDHGALPETADADASAGADGGMTVGQRTKTRSAGRGAARPPSTSLPDLSAQLDYLARWCTTRAPGCARRLVADRARIPLLDAAGLRALRKDAEACVLACRR